MKNCKRISLFLLAVVLLVLMPLHTHAAENEPDWDGARQVIIQAFNTREDTVNLYEYKIPRDQWADFYFELLGSDCSLWFVKKNLSYNSDSGYVYNTFIQYIDPAEEQALRSAANSVISRCIKPGMTDVQKALALHDQLVLNCEYDLTYTNYSAYDALVTGVSVCQGYAEAYGLLLSQVGISAKVATSDPMDHAWNLVQLGGNWYHVDVTWDDPVWDTYGFVDHKYFLCSDARIQQLEHYDWVTDIACNSSAYDSGMYWSDSISAIVFLSGQEAIIRRDSMGEFTIHSRNLQNGQETLLYREDDSYYVSGGMQWLTVTNGLSYWNGELYFNDLVNVYAMSVDGSQVRKVESVSSFPGWECLDGTFVKDGTLYISLGRLDGAYEKESVKLSSSGEHEHSWMNATCTSPKTCSSCGQTEGEPLDHLPSTPVRVEPTCTDWGTVSRISCTTCGMELEAEQLLYPLGHVEKPVAAVAPTCTATGWTEGSVCTVCGEYTVEPKPVAALGHSYDGGTVTREPSADQPGICVYTCLTCGDTKTEEIEYGYELDISGDLNRAKPTKQQIIDAWNAIPVAFEQFAQQPSVKAPYATGALTQDYLNTGIAYLNYIRFVAGLPGVQHSQTLSDNAQYGAVLLAAINTLTHYPSQPSDMDDDFYSAGYSATTTSNISMRAGYGDINYIISSLSGCLADSGSNNLATVGHRRWLLNPRLLNVGFGHAAGQGGSHYIVTKVFDQSGAAVNYDFVSWPASGYVPTNLFAGGDPWSVTLNPSRYKKPVLSNLQITLKREADGESWTFDASTGEPTNYEYPYCTVNNVGYGVANCIIFSPGYNEIEHYSGVYTVEISGLYSTSGNPEKLRYQVEFFDVGACPHTQYKDVVTQPTCERWGDVLRICLRCGYAYTAEMLEPVDHTWDEGKVLIAPTESTNGLRLYSCIYCGKERQELIPALEHTHNYAAEVTAPTCTAQGYTTYTCSCGNSYVSDYVNALDHSYGKWMVIVEASCTEDGLKARTCNRCDSSQTDTIPATGHTPVTDAAKAPTCTEFGLTDGEHCDTCGKILVAQQRIPAAGHSWGKWVETVKPDATKDGVNTRMCTRCGKTQTQTVDNNIFSDVKKDRFEEAILWAYYEGITTGTGDGTTFSPENTCTRKQIVTFLWRAAGEPEPKSMENPFKDVKSDRFEKAILWAYYEGITTGTGDGSTFSPENTCTRKQIVTFLWRYNEKPAPRSDENPFVDVPSDRFEDAILWAYYEGITTGTGDGTTFSPESPCTRKQIVTFLYRDLTE